ncbi:Phage protein [Salmonella phage Tennessee]
MRIISKFADVYDLQNSLFDPDRVWERKTEELTIKAPDDDNYTIMQERRIARIEGKTGYFKILPFFLAGEIYWLYHIDVLDTQVKTFSLDEALEILEEKGWSTGFSLLDINRGKPKESILAWQEEVTPKAEEALTELRVPLAILNSVVPNDKDNNKYFKVITNPRLHLSGIPWQSVEPNLYRLHQRIEQYIWGVLGTGEPDMITVSDKDRLAAHGFDTVTSFRNMKR